MFATGTQLVYILLRHVCLSVCLSVRMFHFFSESTYPPGTPFGTNLCYDKAQPTKQDGVWVMNN